MKLILRWLVRAVLALAVAPGCWSATYTISNAPGWNLIANQLDSPNGNGIRNVIPSAPLGSQLKRFNLATKTFDTIETYQMLATGAQTWIPGTNLLNPGDGLYFYNSSTAKVVLTLNGNPHLPLLPLKIGTGPVLVARQTNAPATVASILGYSPPDFTAVYRFVPATDHDPNVFAPPHYLVYALKVGAWVTPPGPPPLFNVGESVWITTNGSLPSVERQPVSLSVCPNSKASFSAGASGMPPLTYQWLLKGVPIPDATNTSYEISPTQPSDSGNYTLQVSNPFGSATSEVAALTVLDSQPPQISCPPDKVVVATSSRGAQVFYSPSATDNCDPNVTVECTPPSGSFFPLGETVVVCVAKDAAGNSSACAFNVTVLNEACCKDKLWKIVDVIGPRLRLGHSMAYDSARGRVVLFGGTGPNGLMGDTWEWDGSSWAQIPAEGPAARIFAAMAYDSRIGRVVMYGGNGGAAGILSDTWLWDGARWQISNTKPAGPRQGHAMAYDNVRQLTVLYGGVTTDGTELDDTWEFDGDQWLLVAKGSPGPGPRQGQAMAYGSAQRQMLLFGGETKGEVFDDTWQWDGKAWNQLGKGGPPPRAYHAMAYHDNCDSIVLFGGGARFVFSISDTWEWDGRNWNLAATNSPAGRGQLAMAHDSNHGQTVLFGGTQTTKDWLGDTWLYGNDRTPPQVVSVDAACGDQVVVVAFDKPVSALSATSANHYQMVCGGSIMPVLQAILTDDPRIVWLYTSQPISGGCVLLISGVQDLCGRALRSFQWGLECRQDPCTRGSSGREFWLTFPGNYAPDPTNQPQPQLFVAGAVGTVGSVTVLAPPFSAPFSIPAGGVATITLPAAADLGNANDVIQTNGIHVVASRPVSVYGHNHIRYTTDTYLGLSTKAIGRAYLVLAYRNEHTGVPELNGVQFAIAAAQDNTTVTIVPSVDVGVHPPGVPFFLTMMRGQTYQLRDTNDYPADLTGSLIYADKPIAVFGSHQCANIPNANTFFCDYIVEQLPPVELWGNNFVTVPLATRAYGDTFRIFALLNGTTVRTNGGAILPGPLNQGKFFEIQLANATLITSDKPVLVAQYADSSDFDSVTNSDPFMVLIPPTTHYAPSYIVETPVEFTGNYINLMAPTGAVGQINLDGTAILPAAFSQIGSSSYYGAQIPVSSGPHTLFSSNGLPFGVIVYGWNLFDSYGYPGGLCSRGKGETPQFICPTTNAVLEAGSNCVVQVPDFTGQVGNGSLALYISQTPPKGTLVGPGTYPVTLILTDQNGERHLCTMELTVIQGNQPAFSCPPNMVTRCTSPAGAIVNYQVNVCNPNITVIGNPPSGSLFPIGVTTVDCVASNAAGAAQKCSFTVTVECQPTRVNIALSDNGVRLTWEGTGAIQKAIAVSGPWISLSNSSSPFTIIASDREGYFRVVR